MKLESFLRKIFQIKKLICRFFCVLNETKLEHFFVSKMKLKALRVHQNNYLIRR